jgi:hypothetical protein
MRLKSIRKIIPLLIVGILLAACELPALVQEPEDPLVTYAAQTISAIRTQDAIAGFPTQAPTTQPPPTYPPTQPPPATEPPPTGEAPTAPPATSVSASCNDAILFIDDVNYPDGTEVNPGESFEKTWRLENFGTCTWTSAYQLVFDDGDQMGAPDAVPLPDAVPPGEVVDVSVELTAPEEPGSHQGFWKLRNAEGVRFGLGDESEAAFWVKINVKEPGSSTVTLNVDMGESGSVRSDNDLRQGLLNVGDDGNDDGAQVFAAFDISHIPQDAIIDTVEVNFKDFDMLGAPFSDLGCLRAYMQDYGTLGSGDYFTGSPSNAIGRWCAADQLEAVESDEDFEDAMQDLLGEDWFKIRLQFNELETDNDGAADMVRFGAMKLIVTYVID